LPAILHQFVHRGFCVELITYGTILFISKNYNSMHTHKVKGFTLIELLVVIAIIGILSSVVLASLNTARAKGADAAIKSNLANVRAQAEIIYDTNGNYGTDSADCVTAGSLFTDTNVSAAVTQSSTIAGFPAVCFADDATLGAGTAASSWSISVPLKTNAATSWCVDSSGASASGTAVLVGNVAFCQ